LVEQQQLTIRSLDAADSVIQRDPHCCTGALPPALSSRMIDEDPAHHLRRDAEEVRAVLPGDALLANQPEVRLVDQGGWLQRVIRAFATKIRGGSPLEIFVDEWQQLVARREVAVSPRPQQSRNDTRLIAFVLRVHHVAFDLP
jgi:hypothetical protein